MTNTIDMTLSRPAAEFLWSTAKHMNQAKILPADKAAALQTSAWLEEIEARVAIALTTKNSLPED